MEWKWELEWEWWGVVNEEVVAEVEYVGFSNGVWGVEFGGRISNVLNI